ncbi:MAG: single-stranded-DNA-specific exonuclease RecJ [Clostridiales bacterium]|nr:single-stranded-DNA-specific exonuclease RecJ [Clostridiales bacterium]
MLHKKWEIAEADKEAASVLSEKFNIDPFIAFLLVARGIDDELAFSDYISDSKKISDPFLLADMDKAVERIEMAFEAGEKITVFGDYDCDGVTATVLLYSFFKSLGANIDYYIPSRGEEGYGMNISAIDKLCKSGTGLFITVDNGITAFDEAKHIYENGAELIITDHHRLEGEIPKCAAAINPHRAENGMNFSDISGVAVAMKLAAALCGSVDDVLDEYADLVAIGTVGDIMPLVNENRVFVKSGLQKIKEQPSCGVEALKNVAGYAEKEITAQALAFGLCPRINAAGRMGSASLAAQLLLSESMEEARQHADMLDNENSRRREIEENITAEITESLLKSGRALRDRVIIAQGENYHKGVIGIAAAHITQQFGKPTVVISTDGGELATASARSVEGFNIFEAFSACSHLLERFGGHSLAAGFSIKRENIETFRREINEYALQKHTVMPAPTVHIDCRLSPHYLDLSLAESLSVLEPCGVGNPQAVFALVGLNIISASPMGKDGRHLQLRLEKKGKALRVVKFNTPIDEFPFEAGDKIDVAVNITPNMYNGAKYLSIKAVDIRKNGVDDAKYFHEKSVYELFVAGKNNDASVYPDRQACAAVYRLLKAKANKKLSIDDIYFLLGSISYAQLRFALSAFEECDLIRKYNGKIAASPAPQRAELEKTKTIKYLKRRLGIG